MPINATPMVAMVVHELPVMTDTSEQMMQVVEERTSQNRREGSHPEMKNSKALLPHLGLKKHRGRLTLQRPKGFPCGPAVQNQPARQETEETQVRPLSQEDSLELLPWRRAWQATPVILAGKIPWT